jgi:predicted dehydrogenase
VLVEKPLARHPEGARQLRAAAEAASTFSMCAMCMRFWPGWTWLKQAVERGTYGKVLGAQFRRVASHPGGGFYSSGEQAGGAVLDLHIHDTDFIQYCFGVPDSVSTAGYCSVTSEPDHVLTHYRYKEIPLVTAEGGWAMAPGYGFRMQYTVNFERATAQFDQSAEHALTLWERGQKARGVELEPGMGYQYEIAYFLDCIRQNRRPSTVTIRDAAQSVAIVEAEVRSLRSGAPATVERLA